MHQFDQFDISYHLQNPRIWKRESTTLCISETICSQVKMQTSRRKDFLIVKVKLKNSKYFLSFSKNHKKFTFLPSYEVATF